MGPVAVWQPTMQVVLGSLVLGFLGLGHSKQLGDFVSFQHGIRGSLEEGSAEGRLRIRGFSYDGRGPGGSTYFYVVNSSAVYSPEDVARGYSGSEGFKVILPFPFEGTFYEYSDEEAPALDRKFEEEDVDLVLPQSIQVEDITFLSVWCRAYETNFGHVRLG